MDENVAEVVIEADEALMREALEALRTAVKWRHRHDSYMLPGPWFFTAQVAITKLEERLLNE